MDNKTKLKNVLLGLKKTLIQVLVVAGVFYFATLMPSVCHASLESSLLSMKSKLTGFILPVMAVLGMAGAALSFFVGHEDAKKHAIYAAVGCVIGFGAQSIVDFISQTVV
jgi:hypothetical protein